MLRTVHIADTKVKVSPFAIEISFLYCDAIKYLRTLLLNGDLHVNAAANRIVHVILSLPAWLAAVKEVGGHSFEIRTHKRNR